MPRPLKLRLSASARCAVEDLKAPRLTEEARRIASHRRGLERAVIEAQQKLFDFNQNPNSDGRRRGRGRPAEPIEEVCVICAAACDERALGTPERQINRAVLQRIGSSPDKIEKAPDQLKAHVRRVHPHADNAELKAAEGAMVSAALKLLLEHERIGARPCNGRGSRGNSAVVTRFPAVSRRA